jgi:ubiquinone biosynthesis protein COQ9
MPKDIQKIQDRIIEALLPAVPFDGWSKGALSAAAVSSGYEAGMADAVFPGGLKDAVTHFADWADRMMLTRLESVDPETLKIRDRISAAVLTRFEILQPHREALRMAMSYLAMPHHGVHGAKMLWRTADRIWIWAGDTAQDYNHYTKRTLLSGVISTTTLAWLNDSDPSLAATKDFLARRIENVMSLGRVLGKIKGRGAK